MQTIPIVQQRSGCVEIPWVRFLLGPYAGEVVLDPDRTVVVPNCLVVTDRLDLLGPETVERIRTTPGVGLYQISDEWYRDPLAAYGAFAYVWRNHLHTGLRGTPVRQIPLPPAALDPITADPRPEARRPPSERSHVWSFAGQLKSTRFAMIEAFRRVGGGHEHVTGTFDDAEQGVGATAYLDVLAQSVFAPCAMGNVHLESFRVYEALEMGAIPVVERRPWLDYFRELLGDHPLPTVRSWSQAPALVERLRSDPRALDTRQAEIVDWWTGHKRVLASAAQSDVARALDSQARPPAYRVPGRWRGRLEMARHHNAGAAWARARLTARRLRSSGNVRRESPVGGPR
jgi:hypothetical protein